MVFYADIMLAPGVKSRGLTYDVPNKKLVAANSAVVFEQGSDYWALKINGDYSMLFDSDGLLAGDLASGNSAEYPRLDFYATSCGGITQRIATLTQTGQLFVNDVIEADSLPAEGMNILDNVMIGMAGITATAVNEIWFLSTDAGDYITDDDGLMITVR